MISFCYDITKPEWSSRSFKIGITPADCKVFANSMFWPSGVVVRPWVLKTATESINDQQNKPLLANPDSVDNPFDPERPPKRFKDTAVIEGGIALALSSLVMDGDVEEHLNLPSQDCDKDVPVQSIEHNQDQIATGTDLSTNNTQQSNRDSFMDVLVDVGSVNNESKD